MRSRLPPSGSSTFTIMQTLRENPTAEPEGQNQTSEPRVIKFKMLKLMMVEVDQVQQLVCRTV